MRVWMVLGVMLALSSCRPASLGQNDAGGGSEPDSGSFERDGGTPADSGFAPDASTTGDVCRNDNCNTITQNCPILPLDPSRPATEPPCMTLSADCPNPMVPQNCVPLAQGMNTCVPAGSIPVGGTGCTQSCDQILENCVKGGGCMQNINDAGEPVGQPTCLAFCSMPANNPGDGNGCAQGEYCQQVFGPGSMTYFDVGVCQSGDGQEESSPDGGSDAG